MMISNQQIERTLRNFLTGKPRFPFYHISNVVSHFVRVKIWNLSSSTWEGFHESWCFLWLIYIVIPLSSCYLMERNRKNLNRPQELHPRFNAQPAELNILKNKMQHDLLVLNGCIFSGTVSPWKQEKIMVFVQSLPLCPPTSNSTGETFTVIFLPWHFIGSFYKKEQSTKYLQDF